jgi:hypothetical protein
VTSPSLRWLLDPPPQRPAGVYVAGRDAPAPVLRAMVREGLLVPVVGGVHLAADQAGSPAARAAALAEVVPPRGVVGGPSALWVRGLLGACPAVDVLVPAGTTGGSRERPGWLVVRSSAVPARDVATLGPLRVTGLARTAADIARWHEPGRGAVLVAVALAAGCPPGDVRDRLEHPARQPRVRRARGVLDEACALLAAGPA